MKVLSVGSFSGDSNTCVHRNRALQQIGEVNMVDMYEKPHRIWFRIANRFFNYGLPVRLPDMSGCNKKIIKLIEEKKYDIVWVDKGWLVNKKTLMYIKQKSPFTKIVSYSPDNMAVRHNQSQNYLESLPLYDYIFTNKSYISNKMRRLGAKNIFFINNSYEDSFHFPRKLTKEDTLRLGGNVGFVGSWEKERCENLIYLAKNGVSVRVFGGGKWLSYRDRFQNLTIEESGLYDEDYSKSLQAFKISLCFLRKINGDQQTTRTMEIPACGGFMLAERTDEHLGLFEEGKEAAFFSSKEELLEKCKYYLEHEDIRLRVAKAGRARCEQSGYSNTETIKRMLDIIMTDNCHELQ